jgi:hypothetical protein
MLLETFDYLSLLTCFGVESDACGPVPWEVELSPFPFALPYGEAARAG